MSNPEERQDQLYPFIQGREDGNSIQLLTLVKASIQAKSASVIELRRQLLDEYEDAIVQAGRAMAGRFARGGALLAFGNGGSATDATDAVLDCLEPPDSSGRALPAIGLSDQAAVLTGVGNDIGIDHIFSRQILAHGSSDDIALGISTSGNSVNVLAGLTEARRLGMLTVGLAGSAGGRMAAHDCDFCFVARQDHIPRIQEGHATVWHALLEQIQMTLAEGEAFS